MLLQYCIETHLSKHSQSNVKMYADFYISCGLCFNGCVVDDNYIVFEFTGNRDGHLRPAIVVTTGDRITLGSVFYTYETKIVQTATLGRMMEYVLRDMAARDDLPWITEILSRAPVPHFENWRIALSEVRTRACHWLL